MPRGDGTGPRGMGPRSGRAAGYCAGLNAPGFVNPVSGGNAGMGFGRGREGQGRGAGGGGRGWRNWFFATGLPGWMRRGGYAAPDHNMVQNQKSAPQIEKQALKEQADVLQSELNFIKQRLSEIETDSMPERTPSA